MIVLDSAKSDELRYEYVKSFVNTDSSYYIENVERRTMFSDGMCYVGYLWDCLLNCSPDNIICESAADRLLQGKRNFFVMWDIHSCDRIFIPNYWRFPKSCVLYSDDWLNTFKSELPEDVYLFDDTFNWSIIYTHEMDENNNRYCLYITKISRVLDK